MPFSGNTYTPPAGAESAAPGQVVQSAVWDAIFTDLASALTQVMNQFNAIPVSLAGVGTTQAGAAAIGDLQFFIRAIPVTAQYAFIIPATAAAGNRYTVFNEGAVTAVIWPPSGGDVISSSIAGLTATGISLPSGKGIAFLTVTASTFDAMLSL